TLGYSCKAQLLCSVSYDIKVPRGTAVHAEGREGSVTLTSLSGPVTAQTVTGLITASGLTSPSAVLKSGAGASTRRSPLPRHRSRRPPTPERSRSRFPARPLTRSARMPSSG
ncbi:MAG TPA: hypothetical protein VF060_01570, partial [Trebonia sp.]